MNVFEREQEKKDKQELLKTTIVISVSEKGAIYFFVAHFLSDFFRSPEF